MMSEKRYKRSPEERAYFRKRARKWRRKNPEKAKEISRRAGRRYRTKMIASGHKLRLIDGKWKWVKEKTKK